MIFIFRLYFQCVTRRCSFISVITWPVGCVGSMKCVKCALCALSFFCRIWSSYLELSGNFVPSITATTADSFSLNFPTYYFEILIFISTLFLIDFLYKLLLLFLLLSLFLWIYSFPNCLISGLQTVVPECAQTHMNFSGMGEKSFLELLTAESVEMLWMSSSGLIKPVQLINTAHSSAITLSHWARHTVTC